MNVNITNEEAVGMVSFFVVLVWGEGSGELIFLQLKVVDAIFKKIRR